ncbi:LytR family transcriptional regulator [Arthrobacter agilis]|uniref:LytR C-terminal domain-containing protein n=1 Tax=Arthrobacter agilis TaxID=37921 RepID=UPI000B34C22F|nr:LytR C-terminal domain-containing protein [Arthrobacter agilis]OUM40754.1 hypothetical protein B8W74_14855 [Arthrobacter agilis]PPB45360.1 hypothetical protein CI784_14885 [Arthrobacter agilis]TPV28069.1 LytR family transcriptional regulator [Arthrobacter agilis]VDR31230.1 Uncharacterised protein [Arthrobacter agilis]
MTDHPRDEFDAVPETSDRQGVHREHLDPARSSGLGLKITVGVLALLIVLGVFFLLPRLGLFGGNDTGPGAAPASSTTPGPSADALAPDPTGGASGGPAASAPDSDPGVASATATDAGNDAGDDPDRDQTVNVLNGTGAPGLATVAAERLATAGWTAALPGNWAGAPLDSSVVFYNGEAQREAAESVAADLDIATVVESPDVSPDISVVLGPDFE